MNFAEREAWWGLVADLKSVVDRIKNLEDRIKNLEDGKADSMHNHPRELSSADRNAINMHRLIR